VEDGTLGRVDLSCFNESQLVDLFQELSTYEETRKQSPISFYEPHDLGQTPFHRSVARIRALLGGNRSGKSTAGAVEAISHSLGFRPWLRADDPDYFVVNAEGDQISVPNVGTVLGESFKISVERVLWPTMYEWLPRSLVKKINRNQQAVVDKVTFINGSVIQFMTYNQHPKEFEGFKANWTWYDEPPPRPIFIANERSLVDYAGRSWFTLTPIRQPWIWEDIVSQEGENPDVECFKMSSWDNPHISRGSLESYFGSIKDADERRARELGEFLHLQGRVFPMWEPRKPYFIPHEPPKRDWVRVCAIDPHPRKPVAVVWAAISPDSGFWYVYRELYDDSLRSIKQVSNRIHEMERGEKISLRIIDPSARENERTSDASVYEQFMDYDIFCELAQRYDKDGRIRLMRDMLTIDEVYQRPPMVIMDSCRRLRHEMMNYVWDDWTLAVRDSKDPKPEVVKKDDDLIDGLMYLLQYGTEAADFDPQVRSRDHFRSKAIRPERAGAWG
jgi:phage terminase large subunit-like protein